MRKDRRTWDEKTMDGKFFTREEAEANKLDGQSVIETSVVLGAKLTGNMTTGGTMTKVFALVKS